MTPTKRAIARLGGEHTATWFVDEMSRAGLALIDAGELERLRALVSSYETEVAKLIRLHDKDAVQCMSGFRDPGKCYVRPLRAILNEPDAYRASARESKAEGVK